MERVTGELRRIEDLKAAGLVNDAEYAALRKKVLDAPIGAPAGDKDPLVDHFASEALKKHQVWRNPFEDFQLQEAAWKEEDTNAKQETYLNMAKGGGLSELERMLGFYALYGTKADHAFFQALVANVPDNRRVEYHNWYVARARGEAFLAQYGAEIMAGAPPLYGPQKEFGALNVALMKNCSRDVYGAGGSRPIFDVANAVPAAAADKTIFASGYPVPVVDGYVDLGIVEEAINWLDLRIKELEAAMEAAKVAIPAPQRPQPSKKKPATTYQNGGYQNGYRSRGGGGIRGGRACRGNGY